MEGNGRVFYRLYIFIWEVIGYLRFLRKYNEFFVFYVGCLYCNGWFYIYILNGSSKWVKIRENEMKLEGKKCGWEMIGILNKEIGVWILWKYYIYI